MDKKNNFASVIALGNFNPAILTPEFLINKCNFHSDAKPKGQTSPVASSLQFEHINFIMELERFQIVEKEPVDFKTISIVNLMLDYLNVLTYTPVYVVGLNFNVDIASDTAKAIDKLNNKELILDIFDATEIVYDSKIKFSKSGLNHVSWDIINKQGDSFFRLTVNLQDERFQINFNAEKRNVESDRKKINEMNEGMPTLVSEFDRIIGDIFP